MLSPICYKPSESLQREPLPPRRPQRVERVESPAAEQLQIWSVGFSGTAAERVQRSCERVGRLTRRFGDGWRLVQYVMPCFGGALVRRPDLVIVNTDQVSAQDLDWLHEVGGPLPVWKVSSAELSSYSEAELAQRLRAAASSFAEASAAAWP